MARTVRRTGLITLIIGTDHDAFRAYAVSYRSAFLQEFRVGYHVERHVAAAFSQRFAIT